MGAAEAGATRWVSVLAGARVLRLALQASTEGGWVPAPHSAVMYVPTAPPPLSPPHTHPCPCPSAAATIVVFALLPLQPLGAPQHMFESFVAAANADLQAAVRGQESPKLQFKGAPRAGRGRLAHAAASPLWLHLPCKAIRNGTAHICCRLRQ